MKINVYREQEINSKSKITYEIKKGKNYITSNVNDSQSGKSSILDSIFYNLGTFKAFSSQVSSEKMRNPLKYNLSLIFDEGSEIEIERSNERDNSTIYKNGLGIPVSLDEFFEDYWSKIVESNFVGWPKWVSPDSGEVEYIKPLLYSQLFYIRQNSDIKTHTSSWIEWNQIKSFSEAWSLRWVNKKVGNRLSGITNDMVFFVLQKMMLISERDLLPEIRKALETDVHDEVIMKTIKSISSIDIENFVNSNKNQENISTLLEREKKLKKEIRKLRSKKRELEFTGDILENLDAPSFINVDPIQKGEEVFSINEFKEFSLHYSRMISTEEKVKDKLTEIKIDLENKINELLILNKEIYAIKDSSIEEDGKKITTKLILDEIEKIKNSNYTTKKLNKISMSAHVREMNSIMMSRYSEIIDELEGIFKGHSFKKYKEYSNKKFSLLQSSEKVVYILAERLSLYSLYVEKNGKIPFLLIDDPFQAVNHTNKSGLIEDERIIDIVWWLIGKISKLTDSITIASINHNFNKEEWNEIKSVKFE